MYRHCAISYMGTSQQIGQRCMEAVRKFVQKSFSAGAVAVLSAGSPWKSYDTHAAPYKGRTEMVR